jgi:hypothetical protein
MIDPTGPRPDRAAMNLLPLPALIDRFAAGVEVLDGRVLKLADSELDTAFRPEAGVGRWPCRVLLGHLADADLSFVQRMRRVVAEDGPVLPAWDEDAFIDCGLLYGTPETGPRFPVAGFVAAVHTLRAWTAPWLRTLPEAAFQRQGVHTQLGAISVRTILEYAAWHLEHHAWYLNAKVARLNGPAAPGHGAGAGGRA